jgi:hypothetical protein
MNTLIDRLLQRFVPSSIEHLSDEQLASVICRELSFFKTWIAERHLAKCWPCRSRRWHVEGPRAQRMIELHAALTLHPEDCELPEEPRAEFAQWLHVEMRRAAMQPSKQPRSVRQRLHAAMPGVSMISIGLAFGLMVAAIIFSFSGRQTPRISANSLLVHAEKWDPSNTRANQGVVHQTIRIKMAAQSQDRSLYWDMQGKRRLRQTTLASNDEQFKLRLRRAGVDWDCPISASGYQDWHDHQHVRADRITKTGRHLLTLTTTVPEGIVSHESITVRDNDFHPVQRTIGFRDSDTVEIAELDYSVLPWSAVDTSVFEPADNMPLHDVTVSDAAVSPRPHVTLPEFRSPEQLDETELSARLILNNLRADEDEQIEIRRSSQTVEVYGLVKTDLRKHELITRLMSVPGLTLSIRSETDLSASPQNDLESVSVEAAALPDNPSAIETYLRHHDRHISDINNAERQLLEEALTISKESRAILDLKVRFVHAAEMPVVARATLEDLLYSHHERLQKALREERTMLAHLEGSPLATNLAAHPAAHVEPSLPAKLSGKLSLTSAAKKNLELAGELTQTNIAHPRSAEEIFADMAGILDCLFPATREAYGSFESSTLAGRKE